MLLTITTTLQPATDLGYLLHKHPDRVQRFQTAYGTAHVFYPDADRRRCTAALLLDVDPVKLVRTRRRDAPDFSLGQYVNDRPYAASSLLASAMAGVFRTAMRGTCESRPELAAAAIPLEIALPALPCRGGPARAERLFAPLGWRVTARPVPLDPGFPEWGDSRYVELRLAGEQRLADALNHLYVLLPVLDEAKHYWVAADEVDKLVRAGDGWLAGHPERGAIARRYLAGRRGLTRVALRRLADSDDAPEDALDRDPIDEEPAVADPATKGPGGVQPATDAIGPAAAEGAAGPTAPLAEQRIEAVLGTLRAERVSRVIDLGCGSGRLLSRLARDASFERITGVDVSYRAVTIARRKVGADDPASGGPVRERPARSLSGSERTARVEVIQGALTYTDKRFAGHDAAVLMEVIEHVDPPRLGAVERVVFGEARPRVVLVTTPNVEYNVRYPGLARGAVRHPDHRFEWTRAQFAAWAERVAAAYGYRIRYAPVGEVDPRVGPPTQLGVFSR